MQPVPGHEQKATCGVPLNIPLNVLVEKDKISAQVFDSQKEYLGEVEVIETSFGQYLLNYVPQTVGHLTMYISIEDELKHTVQIICSPNKIQLQVPPIDCYVGHQVQILLNISSNIEFLDVEAIFNHSETGSQEQAEITNNKEKKSLVVLFTPQKSGTYVSEINIPGRGPIKGEIVVNAKYLPKMHIIQGNSGNAIVGNTFLLQFKLDNVADNEYPHIEVESPSGNVEKCPLYKSDDDLLFFKYIPSEPGTHNVTIQFVGMKATHLIQARYEIEETEQTYQEPDRFKQSRLQDPQWFMKPPSNFFSDQDFNQEPPEQSRSEFVPLQPVPISVDDSYMDDFTTAEPVLY